MLNLLCIDDEQGVLDLVELLCKRIGGIKYNCCLSGKEALEFLRVESYDIVVIDYLMENMNGHELISKIREFNDNVYIILLTGHFNLMNGINAMNTIDIDSYAEKRSDLEDLHLKILIAIRAVKKYKLSDNISHFGIKLKAIRDKYKLDQKDIATILNISRQAVTNYEIGGNTPKIKHVIKLSEYFNVPTDYFLK